MNKCIRVLLVAYEAISYEFNFLFLLIRF